MSLVNPVRIGNGAFVEPTCALLVGPFSCYCVCTSPGAHEVSFIGQHAEVLEQKAAREASGKIMEPLEKVAPSEQPKLPATYTVDTPMKAESQYDVQKPKVLDEPGIPTAPTVPLLAEPVSPGSFDDSSPSKQLAQVLNSRRWAEARHSCPVALQRCQSDDISESGDRRQDCTWSHGSVPAWGPRHSDTGPIVERAVSESMGNCDGRRPSFLQRLSNIKSAASRAVLTKLGMSRQERESAEFEAKLLKYLEETAPPELSQLSAQGWEDYCTKNYELYCKWLSGPPRILQYVATCTDRMVTSMPAVKVDGKSISGGLFPMLCTVDSFPSWLPFVQSAKLLKQLSPLRRIWQCSVKIGFFQCDFIVLVAVVNRLATRGTIDIVLTSPEPDSEGKEWLGITVPEKTCSLRMSLKAYGMSYTPISEDHGNIEAQMELNDSFPLKRLAVLLIKTGNDKFLPQMEKVSKTFPGSAIDEMLNAETKEARQTRDAFLALRASVDEFLAKKRQGR